MDLVKIKVNLPEKVYTVLETDMEAFGFLKPNGSPNKNGYINAIIKNFFKMFASRELEVITKIRNQVHVKDEDVPAIANMFFEERYKKEGNYIKELQFIIQKENLDIYEEIIELYLANRSVSQYFREMLILFTSYPMDKRESILCKDIISKIQMGIEENRKTIVYLTDGTKKTMDLYGIYGTGEQIFNYLIGIELNGNKRETATYRLNKVKNVVIIPNMTRTFSKEEKEKLDLMIYQGPIFAINEVVDAAVELDEYGKTLYRLWIHDRPKPYKVEGNVYHFKSSLNHIAIYFYKFGTTAKILSPNSLIDFMKARFQEAANLYK